MNKIFLGVFSLTLIFNINVIAQDYYSEIEGKLNPQKYTIEEAYRMASVIRKKFKPFDAVNMSNKEADSIKILFHITDLIVVERVVLQKRIMQGKPVDLYNYEILIEKLSDLEVPDSLAEIKDLIKKSAIEQKSYFDKSQKEGNFDLRSHDVKRSSEKLIKAYKLLLDKFPEESENNKQAFYSHLCAMDLI